MSDTKLTVKHVISEMLGIPQESIKDDSPLDSLDADSLDRVEIVMELESELERDVPDEVAEGWKTVQDIANWFDAQVAA